MQLTYRAALLAFSGESTCHSASSLVASSETSLLTHGRGAVVHHRLLASTTGVHQCSQACQSCVRSVHTFHRHSATPECSLSWAPFSFNRNRLLPDPLELSAHSARLAGHPAQQPPTAHSLHATSAQWEAHRPPQSMVRGDECSVRGRLAQQSPSNGCMRVPLWHKAVVGRGGAHSRVQNESSKAAGHNRTEKETRRCHLPAGGSAEARRTQDRGDG